MTKQNYNKGVAPSGESELEKLRTEIRVIREELLPDRLAKAMDSSYNKIRLFLQILSIMITIFLAGAVTLGVIGTKSIIDIYREAAQVRVAAGNVAKDQNDVAIALQGAKKIEAEMQGRSEKLTDSVNKTIADANNRFDKTVEDMQNQSRLRLAQFEKTVEDRLSRAQRQIDLVQKNLRDIATIFNTLAATEQGTLTPRETQLLTLIAQHIDPNNALFNLNYARSAFYFGRYDEALGSLDKILRQESPSPDLVMSAQSLKKECEKRKASPPSVQQNDPGGMSIGGFSIMQLHVKTVEALLKNGYLRLDQAQQIFDLAKVKQSPP